MIPLLAAATNDKTKKIIMIGGGILVVGVGYFVLSRLVQKKQEEAEKQNYLVSVGTNTNKGRAAAYAVLLRDSMKGWGTSEKELFNALDAMKAEGLTFGEVSKAYKGIYQRDLYLDMSKDLSAKEMVKANAIIQMKGLSGVRKARLNGHSLAKLV